MTPAAFDLSGRVALVTGSSRGLGQVLARGLAEHGATVVMNSRGGEALVAAVGELTDAGLEARAAAFDVTDPEEVAGGIEGIEADVGPIEILVNNAGMQARTPLEQFPTELWDQLLATNLTSAFLVSRAVAGRMIPRGQGKIINICSLQSEASRPGIAPYAATKGALKMLTKGMCADWAPHGLNVNAIGPGYFVTELTQALRDDAEFDAWLRKRTPAGRWGRPEELVGTAVYLASAASDFVNGQVVYVDGGMLAVL
jgi:gluconate 5-dehydrogenase